MRASNRRPILLGEFGACDKSGTPMDLRAAYTSAVRCEAERHRFGWGHWQFDSDFYPLGHEGQWLGQANHGRARACSSPIQ